MPPPRKRKRKRASGFELLLQQMDKHVDKEHNENNTTEEISSHMTELHSQSSSFVCFDEILNALASDGGIPARELHKRLQRPLQLDNAKSNATSAQIQTSSIHQAMQRIQHLVRRARPEEVIREFRQKQVTLDQLQPLRDTWKSYIANVLEQIKLSPHLGTAAYANEILKLDFSFAEADIIVSNSAPHLQGASGVILFETMHTFVFMLHPHSRIVTVPKRNLWLLMRLPNDTCAYIDATQLQHRRGST